MGDSEKMRDSDSLGMQSGANRAPRYLPGAAYREEETPEGGL